MHVLKTCCPSPFVFSLSRFVTIFLLYLFFPICWNLLFTNFFWRILWTCLWKHFYVKIECWQKLEICTQCLCYVDSRTKVRMECKCQEEWKVGVMYEYDCKVDKVSFLQKYLECWTSVGVKSFGKFNLWVTISVILFSTEIL